MLYGISAKYYDAVYGADFGFTDVPFYLELAQASPGPVLELGCGTGRVALVLARAGFQVVGLEKSPAMLEVFTAKLAQEPPEVSQRIVLAEGDMASFDLGRRFGLILTPFRAFMHLLSTEDQRSCLECVVRHLLPAGRFVLDLFDPNLEYIVQRRQAGPCWLLDHESLLANGNILRRCHLVQPEPALQQHRLLFKYEEYSCGGELLSTGVDRADMRWQYRHEAQYLLELCGLRVAAAYGGYDKSPLGAGSREQIYVCRPAAEDGRANGN